MTPEESDLFYKNIGLKVENDKLKLQVSQLKMQVESLHKYYNVDKIYTWNEYVDSRPLTWEEYFNRIYCGKLKKNV